MKEIPVRNPRTGQVDTHITPIDNHQLAGLSSRLRQGQQTWLKRGLEGRIAVLRRFSQLLSGQPYKDKLVEALSWDTGRYSESLLEVELLCDSLKQWCQKAPALLAEAEPKAGSIPYIEIQQDGAPYPLVGVISPWNFPLLLAHIDVVPALLAGCAVLIKPSEITPRFIKPLQEAVAQIPELAEVYALVGGAAETGAALVDQVDLVCFTGSVATGRRVGEACAKRFIPAFLELGGKDPAIVTAEADLERAASALLWAGCVNAGQSCLSIERIYVQRPVVEPFLKLLTAKAERVKLAYPNFDSGVIGPIIAARQSEILRDHLADAKAKGARVHHGGELEKRGGGDYLRPTVLSQVNHNMKVMTEETFGPIMPVMAFNTIDEAVELANDTIFGLSAAVFAKDAAVAAGIAGCLQAGAVSINDAGLTAMIHDAEKQAFKFSGMGGSRMGPASIRRFLRQKAYLINRSSSQNPWWWR